MNRLIILLPISVILSAPDVKADEGPDALCKPLLAFVTSVKVGEAREFTFHTIWGRNFKDSSEKTIYNKRCEHGGYALAKEVCRYFVKNSSAEFAELNARRVASCLSSDTRIGCDAHMDRKPFSCSYASASRGSQVTVEFGEDEKLGGMALRVVAKGE